MKEKPIRRDASIISKNIFMQFTIMGVYITALSIIWFMTSMFRTYFGSETQFRTGYFAFFILASIFNGFNVRTDKLTIFNDLDKNPTFMKVWAAMLVATICICMIDIIPGFGFIGEMFGTTSFGLIGWAVATAMALTIIPVDMIRKLACRTYVND